jgi:hypothetical protein
VRGWQVRQGSTSPTSKDRWFPKLVKGPRPLAIFAFACSAIGLGLLLGTGPVGIFIAPLGVITGFVALVRTSEQGRRGMATAAVVFGSVVTVLSLAMMLGSQAAWPPCPVLRELWLQWVLVPNGR